VRRLALAIVLAIAAVVTVVIVNRPPAVEPGESPPDTASPPAPPSPGPPPAPPARPTTVTTLAVAETAATLNSPETTIEDDFSTLELLFSQYRRHLDRGNPVGDNAEITASLLGRNPKAIACLPAGGPFLDAEKRLIDRWGTPYFFHALSGTRMEIHSAGPDRKLHTPDDLRNEP
jgi:hypothetical protein